MRSQTSKTQKSAKAAPVRSQRSTKPQYSHPVMQLQKKIGNQAVQRLLQSRQIQAKLTVGAANDKYEQEADRVADQIMRTPEPVATDQASNNPSNQTPVIQRLCTKCGDELQGQFLGAMEQKNSKLLQGKEMSGQTPEVSSGLEGSINSLRGAGRPLSPSDRSFYEPRFGQDFSQVRIHNDSLSNQAAQSINARAFTIGRNIAFAAGEYSPDLASSRLMAHELTHVVQQQNENSSLQRHVTDSAAGRIGGASDFVDGQGSEGRYIFTERGGWFDRSHVSAHVNEVNDVLSQLEAREAEVEANTNEFVTSYQMDYEQIPAPIDQSKLSMVALAILTNHDARFEAYQNSSVANVIAQTPFSYEDLPSNRFGSLVGIAWRAAAREREIDPDATVEPGSPADTLRRHVMTTMLQLMEPASAEEGRQIYYGWLEELGWPAPRLGHNVEERIGDLVEMLVPDDVESIVRRVVGAPQQIRDYASSHPSHHSTAPYEDPTLSPVEDPHPLLGLELEDWAWSAAGIDSNYIGSALPEFDRPTRLR